MIKKFNPGFDVNREGCSRRLQGVKGMIARGDGKIQGTNTAGSTVCRYGQTGGR